MRTLLLFIWMLTKYQVSAQSYSLSDQYNDLMNGRSKLEWGKKNVIIQTLDGTKLLRTDEFRPDYLDTSKVTFSANEKVVTLHCKDGFDGCFDRKIIKTKNHSRYSRMTILVANESEALKVIAIWKALLTGENQEE